MLSRDNIGICCSALLTISFLNSCTSGPGEVPDVSHVEVSLDILRWDRQLFELENKQQIQDFLESQPLFSREFLQVEQYPHDSLAVNYLNAFINNPGSAVLQQEIQHVFGDLSGLTHELNQAFRYYKYYYPDAATPKVYTAITGFAGNDLFVSDSAIVIGLDYYLGEGATYRPLDFPRYILKRYRAEYIVPSIVLLMSSKLNKTNVKDNTMLADMVHFGKAYYFAKHILPNSPDSLLIGYSKEDLDNVDKNQDVIWAHFVDQQLLYETSHFVKKKYLDERPKTLEIGDKCPGRIGEWLGWKIVNKYAEEAQLTLTAIMEDSDAQQIFMQSRYKPESR